ncbi:hypothetical protein DL96DRAFT_1591065 [Flagelloscypha sp. PMI_526]|nr:hypothetical protein DL96DRAFT_1591065 [Flagelloscypha sp. PMI_526]
MQAPWPPPASVSSIPAVNIDHAVQAFLANFCSTTSIPHLAPLTHCTFLELLWNYRSFTLFPPTAASDYTLLATLAVVLVQRSIGIPVDLPFSAKLTGLNPSDLSHHFTRIVTLLSSGRVLCGLGNAHDLPVDGRTIRASLTPLHQVSELINAPSSKLQSLVEHVLSGMLDPHFYLVTTAVSAILHLQYPRRTLEDIQLVILTNYLLVFELQNQKEDQTLERDVVDEFAAFVGLEGQLLVDRMRQIHARANDIVVQNVDDRFTATVSTTGLSGLAAILTHLDSKFGAAPRSALRVIFPEEPFAVVTCPPSPFTDAMTPSPVCPTPSYMSYLQVSANNEANENQVYSPIHDQTPIPSDSLLFLEFPSQLRGALRRRGASGSWPQHLDTQVSMPKWGVGDGGIDFSSNAIMDSTGQQC